MPLPPLIRAGFILSALLHTLERAQPAAGVHAFPQNARHDVPPIPAPYPAPENYLQAQIPPSPAPQDFATRDFEHVDAVSGDYDLDEPHVLHRPPPLRGSLNSLSAINRPHPLGSSLNNPSANDGPAPLSASLDSPGANKSPPEPSGLPHSVGTDDDPLSRSSSRDSVSTDSSPPPLNASQQSRTANDSPPPLSGSPNSLRTATALPPSSGSQHSLSGDDSPPPLSSSPNFLTADENHLHYAGPAEHATNPASSNSTFPGDDASSIRSMYDATTLELDWPTESWLRCVGDDMMDRTCHFKNLVYDCYARVFKFLAPRDMLDKMPELSSLGERERLHTTRFLMLGVMSYNYIRDFHIAFVDEPFPPANKTCDDLEPAYLHTMYNGDSYGHILRDNVNVIAGNLLRLGLGYTDRKLIVMNSELSRVLRKYGTYIATRVNSMGETSAQCSRQFILFRDLVAGHGNRTLIASSQRLQREHPCQPQPFLAQRDTALRLAGLPVVSVSQIPVIRVLILDRDPTDKRLIDNIPDLLAPLRQRFPGVEIVTHSLLHLSARDQLKYLSETSVLISTIGSASFRLLYLPTDAHAVLIGAPEFLKQSWADRAVHEATECWNFIDFVTIDVYHVTEEAESVPRFIRRKFEGERPNPRAVARDSDVHVNVTKLGNVLATALADIRLHRETYRLRADSWHAR